MGKKKLQEPSVPVAGPPKKTAHAQIEARFRAVFENFRDAIGVSKNGIHLFENPAYLNLFGFPPETALAGKPVIDVIAPGCHDQINGYILRRKQGKSAPSFYETRGLRTNGTEFDMEVHVSIYQEKGEDHTLVILRDITERKKAEEVLRESENRTRSIIESLPIGMHMYRLEPEGRLVFTGANPAADRILCVDNSIFIGKAIEEAFPALAATEVPQRYREVAATGKAWSTESLEYEEGRIKGAFDVHAFQTSPNAMAVAFKDVTERKQTEAALAKSEKMLKTIIDTEPECVKLLDENGCLIMMNPAGLNMLQVDSMDQVQGRCIYPLVASEYRPAFMELTARIFQGESGTLLFEMVGMKGRRLWLETLAIPLRNEKNAITAMLGITRDITAHKRAGDELREKEEMYRLLFESANEGIFIQNERGFMDCNQRGAEMYGLSKEKLLGHHPDDFAPERQPDGRLSSQVASEKIQAAMSGLPQVFEWQTLHSNGTLFDVEIALSRLELAGKTCLQAIVRDMTDRKRLEQEYLKSQKLESIGTLAGGIAHDFNNLLQGIFGYISMAKMTYDQKEKSLSMLKQAEEALHLAVNLTKQLLTFSKGGKPIRKLISLRPVVENAVKFALSGSQTDYQIDIADDLWPVEADEGQLAQVIQNIVLNADEAMAGSGTVGIVLRNREITMNVPSGLAAGGKFVCIDILDSGTGISKQNLSKIFDPYFTTKQRGSGLGLATSYSIIRNHDGVIEVRSEADKGTTFTIYLPAASGYEPAESDTTAKGITGKTGRILLMDDEPLIRNVAAEMIRTLGHHVESAEEGKTALDMFIRAREAGQPYDVVVLDLTVKGGMGGEETIRRMLEIDSGVTAVVSSGYADSPVVAKYREHGFSAFLNKPYKLDALQDCLGALIP
jgi:PAS domain S-box-containing protein